MSDNEATDDLTPEERVEAEIEETWQEIWEEILIENGELQLDQLKRELFDFSTLMENVSTVYDVLTNGMISKPLTDPAAVISFVEEGEMKRMQEAEEEEGEIAAEMTAYMINRGWMYSNGQFIRNGVSVPYKLARLHFSAGTEPPPF